MFIGELQQRCGICQLIDYCAEPFDNLCICNTKMLENIDVLEYEKFAENKRNLSNEEILESAIKQFEKPEGE